MTKFLQALAAAIPLLLLPTPEAKAAPDGQYCLSNNLATVGDALFHNTAIGIKIRDSEGSIITSGPFGSPYHMKWQSKDICLSSKTGGELEIYSRDVSKAQWLLVRTYNISWLDGIDIQFHKSGRWDDRFGINLSYATGDEDKYPDPDSWMDELVKARPQVQFNELCIPGAHASGSYAQSSSSRVAMPLSEERANYYNHLRKLPGFSSKLAKYYFSSWTKTQSRPVGDLLNTGVRYLNLNLRVIGSEDENAHFQVISAHGLRGAKLDDILNDIQAFLEANTNEFIILDIRPAPKMPLAFIELMYTQIENRLDAAGQLISPSMGIDFPLSKLHNSKARIMAIAPQANEKREWRWKPGTTLTLLNAENNRPDLLRKELAEEATKEGRRGLPLIPLYLTPTVQDFTINPLNISNLEKLNRTLRWPSGIARYTANALRSNNTNAAIISTDFADQHSVYGFCQAEMARVQATPTAGSGSNAEQEPEGSGQISGYKPETPIEEAPEDEKEYPPETIPSPESPVPKVSSPENPALENSALESTAPKNPVEPDSSVPEQGLQQTPENP